MIDLLRRLLLSLLAVGWLATALQFAAGRFELAALLGAAAPPVLGLASPLLAYLLLLVLTVLTPLRAACAFAAAAAPSARIGAPTLLALCGANLAAHAKFALSDAGIAHRRYLATQHCIADALGAALALWSLVKAKTVDRTNEDDEREATPARGQCGRVLSALSVALLVWPTLPFAALLGVLLSTDSAEQYLDTADELTAPLGLFSPRRYSATIGELPAFYLLHLETLFMFAAAVLALSFAAIRARFGSPARRLALAVLSAVALGGFLAIAIGALLHARGSPAHENDLAHLQLAAPFVANCVCLLLLEALYGADRKSSFADSQVPLEERRKKKMK